MVAADKLIKYLFIGTSRNTVVTKYQSERIAEKIPASQPTALFQT